MYNITMKTILTMILAVGIMAGGLFLYFDTPQESVGTPLRVFKSSQIGASPQAGYILGTDGTSSTWQAGGGGGDSISIDGVSVVDPDFVSTGDIDFVDTLNTITANINASSIVVGDLASADFGDWTCNGTVCSLDAGVVDISTHTNLAGDTEIVLTGDTLSIASTIARDTELHDALTLGGTGTYVSLVGQVLTVDPITESDISDLVHTTDTNTTYTGGTNLTLAGTTFNVDDAFLLNNGDIGTGVFDFGGATSFELPNNGTVNANGEITTDDTSGQLRYYAGSAERVVSPNQYAAFTYSTSTAWTGTTTIPLGTAFIAETWNSVQCYTDVGTLDVFFNDGTNNMNDFNASTTANINVLSTNNTFTAGEKRYVDIGNPATAPTEISCTVSKKYDAD